MPKLTRDQQFQISFNEFMTSLSDVFYPDLKEWKLVAKTQNKTSSTHRYELSIPNENVLYRIDPYTDANGVHHLPETVEGEQEVPEPNDLTIHFENYYESFALKQYNTLLSYTSLVNCRNNDAGDLVATIVVCYYKSHLPYPSENKTKEQLKERCDRLEKERKELSEMITEWSLLYQKQEKDIKKLKKQMNKMQVTSVLEKREIVHKMQGKIREFYERDSSKEDCPVCYECIETQQLMVPKCCHYICGSCYDRCDICPICRVEY